MKPALIQLMAFDKQIPKNPKKIGSENEVVALAISSIMALSIGIFPEPRPWHPVLKINIKPRGMKNRDIVFTQNMLCSITIGEELFASIKSFDIGEANRKQKTSANIE